jgi:hypothetical protein
MQNKSSDKPGGKEKPAPKPDHLKIDTKNWEDAVAEVFKMKKPKRGLLDTKVNDKESK